jgi:hypothetical protein
MVSCGNLDADNWREAKVPDEMKEYFERSWYCKQDANTTHVPKPELIVLESPDPKETIRHFRLRSRLKVVPYVVARDGKRLRIERKQA